MSAKVGPSKNTLTLDYESMPSDLSHALKEFDVDNSGSIDVSELYTAARLLQREKKNQTFLRRVIVGLIVVVVVVSGVFAGVCFAVVDGLKDVAASSDGDSTLMVRSSNTAVKTESKVYSVGYSADADPATLAEAFAGVESLALSSARGAVLQLAVSGHLVREDSSVNFFTTFGTVTFNATGYFLDTATFPPAFVQQFGSGGSSSGGAPSAGRKLAAASLAKASVNTKTSPPRGGANAEVASVAKRGR